MKSVRRLIARAYHLFKNDSLFRNAAFLMASTAIMSVLGFGFWIFIAHLYSPAQIGSASALISVTTLLSNLSMLGLNAGLVRFLPKSKNQSRDINAAVVTVGLVTILATTVYLIVSQWLGVHLALLALPWHKAAFVALMATVSLNTLTDAVFVANRRAEYHTVGYTIFAVVKLVLPLFLVPFGSLGIFMAYIFAVIASLLFSFFFMWKVTGYRMMTRPNWGLLSETRKYATSNYIGVLLAGLPSQLMPLIIIRRLGTDSVAYFSMAWTMANLLYVVPSAVTQSLLAESSHDPEKQAMHIKHTVRLLAQILLPAVTIAILVAPHLLKIFGPQYARGGTRIFQLLAFATFFMAISAVCNTIMNIRRRTSGIVVAQVAAVTTTFVASGFLLRYGLTGVGIAMLLGPVTASIAQYFMFIRLRRRAGKLLDEEQINDAGFEIVRAHLPQLLVQYGITDFTFKKLGNGSNNYTILVKHGSDLKVLRVYQRDTKTNREVADEINFMHFLGSNEVPVPKMLPNRTGKITSGLTIDGTTWQYVLMEFESGQHPAHYTASVLYRMAQAQAKIHEYGTVYARRKDQTDNRRAHGGKDVLLSRIVPMGYSHFDFDASNILVEHDDIACVLDFEGMRYGPLVSCVYFTLSRIYEFEPDLPKLKLYLTSYQQIRTLNKIERFILSTALALRFGTLKVFFIYR